MQKKESLKPLNVFLCLVRTQTLLFVVFIFTFALTSVPVFAQEEGGEPVAEEVVEVETNAEASGAGQDYLSEIGQNIADVLPENFSFMQAITDFYGLPETFFDFLPEGFWLYILIGLFAIIVVVLI
jgi:hypothetical protein